MSSFGNLSFGTFHESEVNEVKGHISQLPQSAIIAMYGLPDITTANGSECETKNRPSKESARSAFLNPRETHTETPSKALLNIFNEQGILAALRHWLELLTPSDKIELTNANALQKTTAYLAKGLSLILSCVRWTSSFYSQLHPHHSLQPEEVLRSFAACGTAWAETSVRALAWHSLTLKLAVASSDDAVRVYYGSASEKTLIPILKHPRQKNVSDVKWRPLDASGLAVAAQDGVVLWTVDPNSLSARPSSSCVTFLTQAGHRPVTSLAWSQDSQILFSACPCDNRVIAWDVTRDSAATPLQAITGGGVSLLSFAPDGRRLLTGTPAAEFRVWDAVDWSNEKWTHLAGHLQTCAWSPNGAILLFTTDAETVIYAIDFKTDWATNGQGNQVTQSARPVLDVSQIELSESMADDGCVGGGAIHQMAWDPSGERLALAFQPQTGHPPLVAIYVTRIRSGAGGGVANIEFFPGGLIWGKGDEPYASLLSFCPKFPPGVDTPWSPGALLSLVWANSGRISHHPLHFIPSDQNKASTSLASVLANSQLDLTSLHSLNHSRTENFSFFSPGKDK